MWLDAGLVERLLPYSQERCIDACRYMAEKSLRIIDFRKFKKHDFDRLCIDFTVLIADGPDLLVEKIYLPVTSSEVSDSTDLYTYCFICFAKCSADVEQGLNWMAENDIDWDVGAFLVPCHCGRVEEYNMQRLMKVYWDLPETAKEFLMESTVKWRFWLTHTHGNYSTNIDYLVNWVFAEAVDSFTEAYMVDSS
ncbi:hypothetical protein Aperf_G00000093942 [Anoplocephala perfoliata]